MHAVVFGNMSAIIQRMYSRRATYTTRSNDLKDFSQIHRLPRELKQRMLEFFQTMWSINHGIDPNEVRVRALAVAVAEADVLLALASCSSSCSPCAQIMKEFPEELRGDMALHLYRELLATPLFEAASQGCLKKLAYQCVRYRFSTPGEYLLHRGDRIFCLYFICSGSLEILRNGLVVAILGVCRVRVPLPCRAVPLALSEAGTGSAYRVPRSRPQHAPRLDSCHCQRDKLQQPADLTSCSSVQSTRTRTMHRYTGRVRTQAKATCSAPTCRAAPSRGSSARAPATCSATRSTSKRNSSSSSPRATCVRSPTAI